MKKLTLLAAMLLCLTLAMPALAATVDHAPIVIESDGETATFTLSVENLPETFDLNMASTKEGELEYSYNIAFFDGERAYKVGISEMKSGNNPQRTVPLPMMWSGLYTISGGISNYALECIPAVDGDVITWTLTLPVVDRDGNDCPMDLDNITAYAYTIYNIALDQNERGYFQIQEDGSMEEIDFKAFEKITG